MLKDNIALTSRQGDGCERLDTQKYRACDAAGKNTPVTNSKDLVQSVQCIEEEHCICHCLGHFNRAIQASFHFSCALKEGILMATGVVHSLTGG